MLLQLMTIMTLRRYKNGYITYKSRRCVGIKKIGNENMKLTCPECAFEFKNDKDKRENIYICPHCGHKWFSAQINPI